MDNDELTGLIARCAMRDQRAFQQLYEKTYAYLNAVAFRIVGCPEASNEVLQEAYIQIWDSATEYFPAHSQAKTWMTCIVKYRAIDKKRRENRHINRPSFEEEQDILENAFGADEPERRCFDAILREEIDKCLETMNENFSKSIKLAYIYGYTREELASRLGTNPNTVKSWLRRGSFKLKEGLEANIAL